jgi:hypothetical protein
VIEDFKRAAKAAFPRETYGILIGFDERSAAQRTIVITEIYIPDGVGKFCKAGIVNVQSEWFCAAEEEARGVGAGLVGDIHSHPWTYREWSAIDGVPGRQRSESDHDAVAWDKIAGICRVYETSTGRLRASVRFWPPVVPVKLKLLKRSL